MTRSISALVAALVARAVLAAPAALPPGVMGDVEVSGDRVRYEPSTGRVLLEGNALVKRGAIVLRARSAEWDPATGEVRASGNVLLTDPTRVVSADAVRAVIGGEFEAEGVLAFVKDQPVDLSGVRSAADAGRRGRNRLTFSTPHLSGDADGRMRLTHARLTLCDCPGGAPPSWEVTAAEADVIPGDRAILRWPLLRIAPPFASQTYAVPLLRPPWLYVPLGTRQSGLLIPTIGSTYSGGFTVSQPLYLVLGRSADATLTADWWNGHERSQVAAGEPSIRGPGARLELRWTPAERAEGRAELAWMDDLDAEPGGAHGSRGALLLAHRQVVDDRTAVVAGLQLAFDPVWVRDNTPDVLARALPYRRSDVAVSRRGDAIVAEAAASYLQPLDPVAVGTLAWGALGVDRGVASRVGGAVVDLAPLAAGPLRLSGHLGATRFSALHALGPGDQDVAGRRAVGRVDGRAEAALPLLVGGIVTLAPYLRGAALGYAPDGAAATAIGWGVAGAVAETEVSRRFGSVRHVITPRLEWRAGTTAVGETLRTAAYDVYDRAQVGLSATPGPFDQLRLSVETRLEGARATLARLEVGQDVDLEAGRFAEAFTNVGAAAGPLTLDAGTRFFSIDPRPQAVPPTPGTIPSRLDKVSELHGSVGLRDGRGDALSAGFFSVGPGGSGRLMAGLDPLFDVRAAPIGAAASASLGVRANLGSGALLGYDALLPGRAAFVASCHDPAALRKVEPLQIQQHAGTLTWESPCRCFRLIAAARIDDCGSYTYHVTVDFSRLAAGMRAR